MSAPIKKEPTSSSGSGSASSSSTSATTTIGGAVKVSFAPRIPARRKGAGDGVAASSQANNELRDLITTKVERKPLARAPPTRPTPGSMGGPPAARVAFQPTAPGQTGGGGGGGSIGGASSMSAANEERGDVSILITHQPAVKIPGQHVEPEGSSSSAAAASDGKLRAKKEPMSIDSEGRAPSPEDVAMIEALAEDAAEAELAAAVEREHAYDQFLDNGDPRQYRPILLPFPRVRLGGASHGRSAAPTPMTEPSTSRPGSAFGAATSMFDVGDDAMPLQNTPMYARRTPSPTGNAPYKAFPHNTPARLLGQFDHEEKLAGEIGTTPPRNVLFFQFPSHLPFKQAASWAPPVNPLLSLSGMRQSSLGTNTSAISFGAVTNDVPHQPIAAQSARNLAVPSNPNNLAAPSPSLQALHALSSPALPPLAGSTMPNLSLGASATASKPGLGGRGGASIPHSGLMDDVGTSSALAAEEEQDLGEVGKHDPNKVRIEKTAGRHAHGNVVESILIAGAFYLDLLSFFPDV